MKALLLGWLLIAAPSVFSSDADAMLGFWLTKKGDTIEIYKSDDTYCGRITEIAEPIYEPGDRMAGLPKVDRENPDKSKRQTPIINLQIMKGFSFNGEDRLWEGGTIYDPNNGKTYKCKASFDGEQLRVRGYIGIPALGRTEIWRRK